MILFGSYLESKSYRDIDLCIVLYEKKDNLYMSKKRLEYQKISDKIDVQIFQQLPLYIQKEIINKGKPVLMKDYDSTFDIFWQTNERFEDYKKYYLDYLEYIENGKKAKTYV